MIFTASTPENRGMDWIDRGIALYLVLPLLIFFLWLQPIPQVICIGLSAYGAWRAFQKAGSGKCQVSRWWWVALIAVSMLWTAMSGAGHLMYSNKDWLIRDAVLRDLSTFSWPVIYQPEGRDSLILRAPLGYYLPAALVGRSLGADAAQWALYAWTSVGFALVLAGSISLFAGMRQRVVAIILVMGFGGLDLLGYVWGERRLPQLGEHIEWWMGYIQYSSNSTLLFWVPNHAIPAWLGTLMVLRHWKSRELAALSPMLATAIPLWSPLAAIGLFPFFLFGIHWQRDARVAFSLQSSIPFFPVAAVIALYLSSAATAVPHGWMFETAPSLAAFVYRYVIFCLLEFGLLALVLAKFQPFSPPLKLSLVILLILPFFYYGGGNDLAMRASIPALMVLALSTVGALASQPVNAWQLTLATVVGLGAVGALQEPTRALSTVAWAPMRQSIPEAVAMWDPRIVDKYPPHYFAGMDERGLRLLFGHTVSGENSQQARPE